MGLLEILVFLFIIISNKYLILLSAYYGPGIVINILYITFAKFQVDYRF